MLPDPYSCRSNCLAGVAVEYLVLWALFVKEVSAKGRSFNFAPFSKSYNHICRQLALLGNILPQNRQNKKN